MTFKTKILTAAIAVVPFALSAPAFANDGFFISGGVNSTTQEFNQTRNTGSNQPNVGPAQGASGSVVDKDTSIGFVGGIGYKKHLSNDFFASVEGFYSTENARTTIINNVLVNETELNSTYGVDLRFGTDVTDKVAIYGLFGLSAFDLDTQVTYTFAPPMDLVSQTEWDVVYGGGVEIAFNDRISTFGEFRLTNDVSFDTPTDRGDVTSRNELNYGVIRSGLRFSF